MTHSLVPAPATPRISVGAGHLSPPHTVQHEQTGHPGRLQQLPGLGTTYRKPLPAALIAAAATAVIVLQAQEDQRREYHLQDRCAQRGCSCDREPLPTSRPAARGGGRC
jgi:hypothetical protein